MANRQRLIDNLTPHLAYMLSHTGDIAAEADIPNSRVRSLIARQSLLDFSDAELQKIWEVIERKRGF
jgi:hypothetical protein